MNLTPFGLAIRTIRLQIGMSLKSMAEELNLTSAYLSAIELGERQLTPKLGTQVLSKLGARLDSLQFQTLSTAIDQTIKTVNLAEMSVTDRGLVAAFARRVSAGEGIPDDVKAWIERNK